MRNQKINFLSSDSRLSGFALFLLILSAGTSAFAQVTPQADPGRIEQQIQEKTFRATPKVSAPVVKTQDDTEIPAKFESIKFTLKSISFSGVTVYSADELKNLYQDKVGQTISLADIYRIAAKLTAKYRGDGYILSRAIVPAQQVSGGTASIKVVEGFIDEINIETDGEVRGGIDLIKSYSDMITKEVPLNNRTLERYLLLANDLPGVTVQSVITPSKKTVGAADLKLIVKQQKVSYSVSADNRGTRYMGPLQTNLSANIYSPLAMHDNLSLQYANAPSASNEMNYFGMNYSIPVTASGTVLKLSASKTKTDPGYALSQFEVEGDSHRLSIGVDQSIVRSRTKNITAYTSFESKTSENKANVGGLEFKDRLSVLRAGVNGSYADELRGYNSLNFEVSKGLNILGATDNPALDNLSRAAGRSDFTKAQVTISRLQAIDERVLLNLSLTGQKSANTLLSSEEFGVGGAGYGRAYDSSEIAGEDGVAFSAEVRYDADSLVPQVRNLQYYTFYDVGAVYNRDAADRKESLSSAGIGVNAVLFDGVNGNVELAKPLTRKVDTEGNTNPRVFASLGYSF